MAYNPGQSGPYRNQPGSQNPYGQPTSNTYGAGPYGGHAYGQPAQQGHAPYGNPYGQAPQTGYGQQAPYGPPGVPPGLDPMLVNLFRSVDRDNSGEISAAELQSALSNGTWQPFNPETVRLMINMFDTDFSGAINLQEFVSLWKYITDWQNTFRAYDRDGSGTIDEQELGLALRNFGFNVSPSMVSLLVRKFDRSGRRAITFDDFIQCCVTLQILTQAFKAEDRQLRGVVELPFEKFLEMVFSIKF